MAPGRVLRLVSTRVCDMVSKKNLCLLSKDKGQNGTLVREFISLNDIFLELLAYKCKKFGPQIALFIFYPENLEKYALVMENLA